MMIKYLETWKKQQQNILETGELREIAALAEDLGLACRHIL